jgi:hypothetical protein
MINLRGTGMSKFFLEIKKIIFSREKLEIYLVIDMVPCCWFTLLAAVIRAGVGAQEKGKRKAEPHNSPKLKRRLI